jgi:hypothetical protein
MLKILYAISCVALCCVPASSVWAEQRDLAAADWSVKSPHSLAANPPSDDAVLALVNKLNSPVDFHSICSSHFADLRHSGNLSLVVAASDGRFCSLSIIDKTLSGFELYGVGLAHSSEGPEIKDLAGNGNLELIVDTDFTSYYAVHHCMATWPVIYAWSGSGYADVSSQHKRYYEQQLASLKKYIAVSSSAAEQAQAPAANQTADSQLAPISHAHFGSPKSDISDQLPSRVSIVQKEPLAQAATPAAMPDLADDCTEAEAAKIERFLGISRDAGMTDAIKWANSDDPYRRQFAADVLEDIGTPDAIDYLRTLSNDTDKTVAAIAKDNLGTVLRGVGQGPDLYTVERQEVEQPLAGSPPK